MPKTKITLARSNQTDGHQKRASQPTKDELAKLATKDDLSKLAMKVDALTDFVPNAFQRVNEKLDEQPCAG